MNVLKFKKGALNTSTIIGVIIAVIVLVAAGIPVVVDVVNNVSPTVSGTTATILNLLPLFLGLAALVLVASGLMKSGN